MNFLRTCILFLMLYLIFEKQITVGQFFSLLIYSFFIFGPLQELGNVINIYRETEASLANFEAIFKIPIDPKPANPVARERPAHARVRGRELHAPDRGRRRRWPASASACDAGRPSRSSGRRARGRRRSSSCSSASIGRAHGRILYNGVPSDRIDLDRFRERIGFVTQDAQLFSGTIRENLLFVRPDATDDQCLDVMRRAAATSLLKRADKGLDTVIGEGGMKISGGEKQRLSIARALLRDPHLLVFDEATSSLDSLTEEEISRTMRDVAESADVITVLIAHRLSTVLHADTIYVLERGRIVEQGHHDELLERKGLYYAMWRQQVGERRTEPAVAAAGDGWGGLNFNGEYRVLTDVPSTETRHTRLPRMARTLHDPRRPDLGVPERLDEHSWEPSDRYQVRCYFSTRYCVVAVSTQNLPSRYVSTLHPL